MTTNKNIKYFTFDVQVKDSGVFAKKSEALLKEFVDSIREKGYVPVYDLDYNVSVDYDKIKSVFDYSITLYGIFLGKKKAWKYEGVVNGTLVPKPTPPNK